jgi:tetratricopeptide (TPR) repeat protein
MSNLANVYMTKMKYDDAEPILADIVKESRERFGDGHTETMNVLFSLAKFYNSQGRLDDAARVFFECHEMLSRVSVTTDGTSVHILLLITAKSYLADVYAKQGLHLRALEIHIDCFERRCKIF